MNKRLIILITSFTILLSGCYSTPEKKAKEKYQTRESYLKGDQDSTVNNLLPNEEQGLSETEQFEAIKPLVLDSQSSLNTENLQAVFTESEMVTLAANSMPLDEFLHYTFGEILGVNYILGNEVKLDAQPITLNIQEPISKRQMFNQITAILARQQVNVDFDNNLFFIDKTPLSSAKAIIGIGRDISSIPNTSGRILQIIPITYGIKLSIQRTLHQLIDGDIVSDSEQNAVFVTGDRANIVRAIELIRLLDVPANKGKYIGLLKLNYMNTDAFLEKLPILMGNEGISVGIDSQTNQSILLVPIEHISAIAVFAPTSEMLNRVKYWVSVLDKPSNGNTVQYFVYNPSYARAADLGNSISGLLGLGANNLQANQASTGINAQNIQQSGSQGEVSSSSGGENATFSGESVAFVVDERSNSLIFRTTEAQYRNLYPLLEKLDVLPKQVLLEMVIAEVTLSGNFAFGVEFALRNSNRFNVSDNFTVGGQDAAGLALGFSSLSGDVLTSFFKSSNFVNTLSNPTLLVRDGVEASISVGTDIAVVGSAITDPVNGTTQSIEYRQTGLNVSVTPTVNAQGVVIMEIAQSMSNELTGTAGPGGAPDIFERELNTEVVVQSGSTVLLGGLISESVNDTENKVPGLGNIPLLGNLFKDKSEQKVKTELVLLVTPRVIDQNDNWDKILKDFQNGLDNIELVK